MSLFPTLFHLGRSIAHSAVIGLSLQKKLYKILFLGENLGCFGGSKKKKEGSSSSNSTSPLGKSEPENQPLGEPPANTQLGYSVPKGTEMLWSPEVRLLELSRLFYR